MATTSPPPPMVTIIRGATGLRNMDSGRRGNLSDPYVRASTRTVHVQTPVVYNNLNPTWNYGFLTSLPPSSKKHTIRFSVFDCDRGRFVDGSDDFLGMVEVDLKTLDLKAGEWREMSVPLGGEEHVTGELHLSFRLYADVQVTVHRGINLRNADVGSKSDPYAVLAGLGEGLVWGKTRVIKNDLNPVFEQSFRIGLLDRMPLGGALVPFTIVVSDKDYYSSDDPLGKAVVHWPLIWPESGLLSEHVFDLTGKGAGLGRIVVSFKALEESATTTPAPSPEAAEMAPEATEVAREDEAKQCDESTEVPENNASSPPPPPPTQEAVTSLPPLPASPATPKPIKLGKHASVAQLRRNVALKVGDLCDTPPKVLTFSLRWNAEVAEALELAASCVILDENLHELSTVAPFQDKDLNDAVTYTTHGQGGTGPDYVRIYPDKLSATTAKYLGLALNGFTGHLVRVQDATCELYAEGDDGTDQHEVAIFQADHQRRESDASKSVLMCLLIREGEDWYLQTVGRFSRGSHTGEIANEFRTYLLDKGLVEPHAHEDLPTATAKFSVPANLGPMRRVSLASPWGTNQLVKIPEGLESGKMVEVDLVPIQVSQ